MKYFDFNTRKLVSTGSKWLIKHKRKSPFYSVQSTRKSSMLGAGVVVGDEEFITHSTLPLTMSAAKTVSGEQKIFGILIFLLALTVAALNAKDLMIGVLAVLSFAYFCDVIFSMVLVARSLRMPPEVKISKEKLASIDVKQLPTYSILVPLFREGAVVPQFLANMAKLDYPQDKLEVLLLLEENDEETLTATRKAKLPDYVKVVIVPHSLPKTKPKACNYGLGLASGELLVVYDAEDQPEPDQLKKAAIAFSVLGEEVCCLQAKLNYYNPDHNLLTKLFTAEYSLWFDLMLPALQSINTTIPLGGTSNHFRRQDLIDLHGWDAFNVTEDCDLGVRLFLLGKKTAIIDSMTLEEANSSVGNWIRQRSRWIKGYFQTYLVHMRNPVELTRKLGWHALLLQLVIGARTVFMLINPLLWMLTLAYFVLHSLVGTAIESVYPTPVFYLAIISCVLGNFFYLYNYMIACAKRGQWGLLKYVYLVPLYWLLVSLAALKAFSQLVVKPHYWEKTNHGLHLNPKLRRFNVSFPYGDKWRLAVTGLNPAMLGAVFLVFSTLANYFLNFLYNAFLSRSSGVDSAGFALLSLLGSFIYLASIPMGAVIRTVAHQSAFSLGKVKLVNRDYWQAVRSKVKMISLVVALFWVAATPMMEGFFHVSSPLPLLAFTPIWILGTLSAVDVGYLSGGLRFAKLGCLMLVEAGSRLIMTMLIVVLGHPDLVYLATPMSVGLSFSLGYWWARRVKEVAHDKQSFSTKFYLSSIVVNLSSVVYLGGDILLSQHFLSPIEAAQYAILSLVGRMVFFLGSLFSQFIVPIVSREEGAGRQSARFFNVFFLGTLVFGLSSYVVFGVFGRISAPLLWSSRVDGVVRFLPMYTLGMLLFSLCGVIVNFHQSQGKKYFAPAAFLLSCSELVGILLFHQSIDQFVWAMFCGATFSISVLVAMHIFSGLATDLLANAKAFLGLFAKLPKGREALPNRKRILVFNWRDSRHVWAGGAEVYIGELAKRWVAKGHSVTIFCGNDGKCSRSEQIDGVEIIRRGGFYFVYVWAFLYYMIKFRGKFDVIVDCENGIPFFTPLYVKERVVLLIHHVHVNVFKVNFRPPVSWIGPVLEKYLMRYVYRNVTVVTVSPSSKKEILDHHLTDSNPAIIYNGVDLNRFQPGIKSVEPTVLYLGRLRFHKSLDVFIRTAQKVAQTHPKVEFIIAGDGQQRKQLEKMVAGMQMENVVKFLGNVSEAKKVELYQQAWVFMNPSLMEGWGVTAIEANACATPVVASNVAGLRDSVKNPHTGFLVQYGDVDQFAKRIECLIDDADLRQKCSRYAVSWAKKFDWNRSADKFLQVLNEQKS